MCQSFFFFELCFHLQRDNQYKGKRYYKHGDNMNKLFRIGRWCLENRPLSKQLLLVKQPQRKSTLFKNKKSEVIWAMRWDDSTQHG